MLLAFIHDAVQVTNVWVAAIFPLFLNLALLILPLIVVVGFLIETAHFSSELLKKRRKDP